MTPIKIYKAGITSTVSFLQLPEKKKNTSLMEEGIDCLRKWLK